MSRVAPRPMPSLKEHLERQRSGPKPRRPLQKVGKRGQRRQSENRKLNKLGIRECEVRIPGKCVRFIMLTWAHSKKSRFLVTEADWQEAARCCIPCHDHIEALTHTEMHTVVCEAIARRTTRKNTNA